ncbi:MAG: NDP-sugar synthase, partial [Actinobacteria bacterium]|nr:NDP-sugar synthase [Actinomycetota bacterium]
MSSYPPGSPGRIGAEPLEAILLVGGQGTRLRPLTIGTPKPLLPTAGVPFLAHQLAKAAAAGVTRVVLATAYRAGMFAECLADGSSFGLEIEYAQEETPLGTGGAIRNAATALRCSGDSPVLILNGDILSGHDITAQVETHLKADAAVTLHLVQVPDPARFGCVPTDPGGRVTAFLEKTPDPVTDRVNAGCYVFRRDVIGQIPPGRVVSVERETFPALIGGGQVVMGFHDSSYWLDVGTPEAFVRGSCDLVLGRLESPALAALPGIGSEALVLGGAQVSAGARVGGGTVIGPGSSVADGAEVTGSVLFDGVTVGPGAKVTGSVLGPAARVAGGAVLDGVVIGEGAVVAEGNELRAGLRVWPGVELAPTSVRFSTDA